MNADFDHLVEVEGEGLSSENWVIQVESAEVRVQFIFFSRINLHHAEDNKFHDKSSKNTTTREKFTTKEEKPRDSWKKGSIVYPKN